MWETIGQVALKYWVEFALGLIVAGGGFLIKRYLKLAKAERAREQEELFKKFTNGVKTENNTLVESLTQQYTDLDTKVNEQYDVLHNEFQDAMTAGRAEVQAEDQELQSQISSLTDEVSHLKAGLLSIQGKEFKENCRALLREDHEITLDEWEDLDADHEAYNGLGGNHKGDHLYELVKKKAEQTLTK